MKYLLPIGIVFGVVGFGLLQTLAVQSTGDFNDPALLGLIGVGLLALGKARSQQSKSE